MAAIEKCVLENPFRATFAKEDTPSPSPCVNGARFNTHTDPGRRAGRGGRGQYRPAPRGPKRPFPAACDFYCDACEQGFANHVELSSHYSEHVACTRDGCSFSANPTLVALHEKLQHDSPLIRRSGGVAPSIDDVEEWRRQRRLRYPTLRNIEAKKAAQAEQQMRREVLRDDSKRRRVKRRRHGRRNACAPNRTPQQQPPPPPPPPSVREASPREASPVKPSPNEPDQITDSESDSEKKPATAAPPSPPAVSGALASLMACYNSDSDEPPEEIQQDVPSSVVVPDQAASSQVTSSPATPTETTPVTAMLPQQTPTPNKAPLRQKPTYRPPQRRLTLLQKLLAAEVRHERNVILQCVHHVVENDFFGASGPKSDVCG